MSPTKSVTVNGNLVEQFWWAGRYVVYVNHCSTNETFDAAVKRLEVATAQKGTVTQ